MDETLNRITELLSRRRDELRRLFEGSTARERTTADLLDRVQRLQSRLDSHVTPVQKRDDK